MSIPNKTHLIHETFTQTKIIILRLMCQLLVSTHINQPVSIIKLLYSSCTYFIIGHTLGRASSFRSTSEEVCCYHGNRSLITLIGA